jgi:hypothetical protein
MKKTLLTLGLLASMAATAQNSSVVSAYMAMEDNKLAEAAGYIDPAILNEGTMVKEKTWRYRGQIYSRILFSPVPRCVGQGCGQLPESHGARHQGR